MECNGVHSDTGKVAGSSIIPAGNREKDAALQAVAPPSLFPDLGSRVRKAEPPVNVTSGCKCM